MITVFLSRQSLTLTVARPGANSHQKFKVAT